MLPEIIKPFLWSYDFEKMDKEKDKIRIITNVLNLGSKEAVSWVFDNYSKEEIKAVVADPAPGEWSRKSLNFWSLCFDLKLNFKKREIFK
jgi:hypothetical protein